MVLDQDLRRLTDIHTYEAACWPSFASEIIFYASSDGVTCYATYVWLCIDKCYVFWQQKVGGTKDIIPPSPP